MNKKNVQISMELFFDCCMIIYAGSDNPKIWERASKQLEDKLNAMKRHQTYSEYKTAKTDEERKQSKIEYIKTLQLKT